LPAKPKIIYGQGLLFIENKNISDSKLFSVVRFDQEDVRWNKDIRSIRRRWKEVMDCLHGS